MGKLCFTLDVLSDGSEFTGATIFLSVWKQPTSTLRPTTSTTNTTTTTNNMEGEKQQQQEQEQREWLKETMEMSSPLARYAITGLGDATARLCADQRMKLSPTRAVFLPFVNNNSNPTMTSAAEGLSSLLLALHTSGSASLHVVSSNVDIVEEIASITLGTHRNLNIRTCQIPASSSLNNKNNKTWWNVYQDEYLVVHAREEEEEGINGDGSSSSSSSILYLYSLLKGVDDEKKIHTIALIPPLKNYWSTIHALEKEEEELPCIQQQQQKGNAAATTTTTTTTRISIDSIITLDASTEFLLFDDDNNKEYHPSKSKKRSDATFFITLPNHRRCQQQQQQQKEENNKAMIIDPGLLIRSRQLLEYFSHNMPWAFPSLTNKLGCTTTPITSNRSITNEYPSSSSSSSTIVDESNSTNQPLIVLESCTSVILDGPSSPILLDRRKDILNRPISEEWSATLKSLESFIQKPSPSQSSSTILDENEIDLDDDDDEEEEESDGNVSYYLESFQKEPQVVVLGTGCASPSAIRGASGYALVMPPSPPPATTIMNHNHQKGKKKTREIFLLDAGEGVTTMLFRTCSHVEEDNWLECIKGIWISHAHLDHYGGLPTLICEIWKAQQQKRQKDDKQYYSRQDSKRYKQAANGDDHSPPWVMAPIKVLRYLDVLLGCKHGVRISRNSNSNQQQQQLFLPWTHQDPTIPPGPWTWFQNIKVYHNCCPSYGLLIRVGEDGDWLCYSGDTRPCKSLVLACQRALQRFGGSSSSSPSSGGPSSSRSLLLIHEATFEDNEQDLAERKKHSTVSEALQIASDIPANRVLLTHFSQRYISIESSSSSSSSKTTTTTKIPTMGIAMDGLRLSLKG